MAWTIISIRMGISKVSFEFPRLSQGLTTARWIMAVMEAGIMEVEGMMVVGVLMVEEEILVVEVSKALRVVL
jgi:hypothetical protein